MEVVQWFLEHYDELAAIIVGALGVAQIVVRLTPTKEDDGFVKRLGDKIDKVMDFLKIPNLKKK